MEIRCYYNASWKHEIPPASCQTREEGVFVIMPGLGREVQRGTVVEPSILTTHECLMCPPNCGEKIDFHPTIRISPYTTPIIMDSSCRVFNTYEEATKMVMFVGSNPKNYEAGQWDRSQNPI